MVAVCLGISDPEDPRTLCRWFDEFRTSGGPRRSSWTGNNPAGFMIDTSRVSVMFCPLPRWVWHGPSPKSAASRPHAQICSFEKLISFDLISEGASAFYLNSHSEQNHHCFCAYKWSAAAMASIYKVNCCIHFSDNIKANPCIVCLKSFLGLLRYSTLCIPFIC
jgi:hypothetical protein